MDDLRTQKIAALNDQLRKTLTGGKVLITCGVSDLPEETQERLINKIKAFNEFTEDNDPYKEHDFGKVEIDGQGFYWKIDYYDRNLEFHSEDASCPIKTTRVLTIMLTDEY